MFFNHTGFILLISTGVWRINYLIEIFQKMKIDFNLRILSEIPK